MLSILKASTLLGLLSQSSGAISKPVRADIRSISKIYSSTIGKLSSDDDREVVLVVSPDCRVVGGVIIFDSLTSVSEEHAIITMHKNMILILFI